MIVITPEMLDTMERRTWSKHPVKLSDDESRALIHEVRQLRAQTALLTDAVVMAAALWFAQLDGPQADSASEALHELAKDLVEAHPRLRASFRPEV